MADDDRIASVLGHEPPLDTGTPLDKWMAEAGEVLGETRTRPDETRFERLEREALKLLPNCRGSEAAVVYALLAIARAVYDR